MKKVPMRSPGASLKLPLVLLLALAACALAQTKVNDERRANLSSLVRAERDFARTAGEKGMKDAFLAFAADDGIIFRRTAVNARQVWTQAQPSTGLLSWQPAFADVSRAGDLGYTTGPYEFREKAADEKPVGQGQYMTIWRRQPGGDWKFVLDFGTRNPPASQNRTATATLALRFADDDGWTGGARRTAKPDAASTSDAILDQERAFSAQATAKGIAAAYLAHLAEDARLLKHDAFPLVGREQFRPALQAQTRPFSWQPARAFISASGDLGYAYGTYESSDRSGDAKAAEQGNYVRIWKRRADGQWKIVVEVTNPVPPQPPARPSTSQ